MKTKLTAIALVAVAALAFAPKPAKAGDEGLAAIGGFIGGVIVGSVINDSNRHGNHGSIGVEVGYNSGYRGDYRHDDRGYWKNVTVRTWVPARWVIEYDRYGRQYRRQIGGHYINRIERVWVAHNHHRGYDRHDRYDRYDRYDRDDRYGRRGYGYNR